MDRRTNISVCRNCEPLFSSLPPIYRRKERWKGLPHGLTNQGNMVDSAGQACSGYFIFAVCQFRHRQAWQGNRSGGADATRVCQSGSASDSAFLGMASVVNARIVTSC